ncbi:MAG TPA: s-methyl-5-thioribose-1-phosphate isomerase [Rectinemataceae bacterium]|nr:s-methyl-5-thioribose-1-phosphate isomerase [Rectinemataceae bacterium]
MERQDKDLAFMLKYENVAWYEDGAVRILDRRVYPARVEYVACGTYADVIAAIKAMVTQSGGPYLAAGMGMALAAKALDDDKGSFPSRIAKASFEISHARPTTAEKMAAITEVCAKVAIEAKAAGIAPDKAVFDHTIDAVNKRYARSAAGAKYLVDQFPDNGTVMTQCFAETIVGMMLRECRARGKVIKVICPETRPYFQGARLTASVVRDMDFDVTVITDNMPGYTMKAKHVDVFTSAADVICMDGHIVNKVGTFQIALAARYWGIPYFCTGSPNRQHPTIDTVKIEERDENDVLEAMGVRTAMRGVRGFYPAFDITPPKLCDGIVTDKGIFPPYDLARYYAS